MTATQLSLPLVREIVALHEEIIQSARTTLDKAIRIGELLAQQKAALKHGQWLPWIEANLPFSEDTAGRYMGIFKRRDQIPQSAEFQLTDAYRLLAAPEEPEADLPLKEPYVAFNSGDTEWYTPEPYVIAARKVMGGIDLDPASSEEANKVVAATSFFSDADDGLTHEWAGRVWMNPPYASKLIGKFCEKLSADFEERKVKQAIALVNNATETGWFQELCLHARAICFPKGRVKFWHPRKESAPLQGQAVVYLGPKREKFVKAFHEFGISCIIQ